MTTIYVPRLIESAEQAEALPVGTVAMTADIYQVSRKIEDDGAWQRTDLIDDLGRDEDMVGWTALVLIEAQESRDEGVGWIVPTAFGPKLLGAYLGSPDDTPSKRYTQTTWRTPWEEQS